jgi:hypothetical protein
VNASACFACFACLCKKKTFSFADSSDDDLFYKECATEILPYKNLMID